VQAVVLALRASLGTARGGVPNVISAAKSKKPLYPETVNAIEAIWEHISFCPNAEPNLDVQVRIFSEPESERGVRFRFGSGSNRFLNRTLPPLYTCDLLISGVVSSKRDNASHKMVTFQQRRTSYAPQHKLRAQGGPKYE
jgi:hypothetical protein